MSALAPDNEHLWVYLGPAREWEEKGGISGKDWFKRDFNIDVEDTQLFFVVHSHGYAWLRHEDFITKEKANNGQTNG